MSYTNFETPNIFELMIHRRKVWSSIRWIMAVNMSSVQKHTNHWPPKVSCQHLPLVHASLHIHHLKHTLHQGVSATKSLIYIKLNGLSNIEMINTRNIQFLKIYKMLVCNILQLLLWTIKGFHSSITSKTGEISKLL